jgi:hypothetical protein
MKYKVTRTFINFIKGDEVEKEKLEEKLTPSYIKELIKYGYLKEIKNNE